MITAIVAVDNDYGIGFNNGLLEHIPEDLKFFKSKTDGAMVIMGRKTWESLPKKPLPNRFNVIITSNPEESNDVLINYASMEEVKSFLDLDPNVRIFVIGGGSIYRALLPYCHEAYVTKIFKSHENVDTYFPNLEEMPEWRLEDCSEIKTYNDIDYQFQHYRRH